MSDDKFAGLLGIVAITLLLLLGYILEEKRNKLAQYEDTIAEYTMCIKYNSDCDCSDIILSEYGEEVE